MDCTSSEPEDQEIRQASTVQYSGREEFLLFKMDSSLALYDVKVILSIHAR